MTQIIPYDSHDVLGFDHGRSEILVNNLNRAWMLPPRQWSKENLEKIAIEVLELPCSVLGFEQCRQKGAHHLFDYIDSHKKDYGKKVVIVPHWGTSDRCPNCGNYWNNTKSIVTFNCGNGCPQDRRQTIAAINVKKLTIDILNNRLFYEEIATLKAHYKFRYGECPQPVRQLCREFNRKFQFVHLYPHNATGILKKAGLGEIFHKQSSALIGSPSSNCRWFVGHSRLSISESLRKIKKTIGYDIALMNPYLRLEHIKKIKSKSRCVFLFEKFIKLLVPYGHYVNSSRLDDSFRQSLLDNGFKVSSFASGARYIYPDGGSSGLTIFKDTLHKILTNIIKPYISPSHIMSVNEYHISADIARKLQYHRQAINGCQLIKRLECHGLILSLSQEEIELIQDCGMVYRSCPTGHLFSLPTEGKKSIGRVFKELADKIPKSPSVCNPNLTLPLATYLNRHGYCLTMQAFLKECENLGLLITAEIVKLCAHSMGWVVIQLSESRMQRTFLAPAPTTESSLTEFYESRFKLATNKIAESLGWHELTHGSSAGSLAQMSAKRKGCIGQLIMADILWTDHRIIIHRRVHDSDLHLFIKFGWKIKSVNETHYFIPSMLKQRVANSLIHQLRSIAQESSSLQKFVTDITKESTHNLRQLSRNPSAAVWTYTELYNMLCTRGVEINPKDPANQAIMVSEKWTLEKRQTGSSSYTIFCIPPMPIVDFDRLYQQQVENTNNN